MSLDPTEFGLPPWSSQGFRHIEKYGDNGWAYLPDNMPKPLHMRGVPSRTRAATLNEDGLVLGRTEEMTTARFAQRNGLALDPSAYDYDSGVYRLPTTTLLMYTDPDVIVADEMPLAPSTEGQAERPEPLKPDARRKAYGDATIKQLSDGYYYTPDAASYPNPYFLELYEDYGKDNTSPPMDAVSLRYVNKVTKSDPIALVRTRGMDGSVYQENEGFMQATFTLTGRSGDSVVDLVRFQKMRNFLAKYASESKKHKSALVRGKNVQLVLYFPFEAEAYLCDVTSFDYERTSGSSTCSFEYRLSIITNAPVGNKWKLPETANALARLVSSYDNNHKDPNHPCGKLKKAEEDDRPPNDGPDIDGPTRDAADNPETGCVDVQAGTLSIMRYATWADTLTLLESRQVFFSYFYSLLFASDMANAGMVTSGSAYIDCTPPAYSTAFFLANIGLYTTRTNIRPNMAPATIPGVPIPTEVYVCTQGRTNCYDIAEDVYGDRSRADELIDYNSFLDAYTRGDGTPLDTGDTLAVPRPTGAITRNGDVYGTDLKLVNGDLVPVGTEDIAVISGYDCYAQNLNHRMTTIQGGNKTYPRYGLKPYIGQVNTSDVPGDLRANVRSQLQSDHRTDRVKSIVVTELGDKVDVQVIVQPIGLNPTQVSFTYSLEA